VSSTSRDKSISQMTQNVRSSILYAPAINKSIDYAILIPLCEWRVADRAAEAVDMKDQVTGAHDHFIGANRGQAAGTAASAKKTVKKKITIELLNT